MNPVTLGGSSPVAELVSRKSHASSVQFQLPQEESDQATIAARQLAQLGRVFLNQKAGNLSQDQASSLYASIGDLHAKIQDLKNSGGGTLSQQDVDAITGMEDGLSQDIYTTAHPDAPPVPPPADNTAGPILRTAIETVRVAANQKAGKITGDQASQFLTQISGTFTQIQTSAQANGGSLSADDLAALRSIQDTLSKQIHLAANPDLSNSEI